MAGPVEPGTGEFGIVEAVVTGAAYEGALPVIALDAVGVAAAVRATAAGGV